MKNKQDEEWENIRQKYIQINKKRAYVDSEKCRNCIWANIESGYILCSRICDGKRCYQKK